MAGVPATLGRYGKQESISRAISELKDLFGSFYSLLKVCVKAYMQSLVINQ